MRTATGCRYAVVSMVDSTPSVASLSSLVPLVDSLGVFREEVEGDIAVEASTLLALVYDYDFLTGFDEVWLCAEVPTSPKPANVKITADLPLVGAPPAGLADWMGAAQCIVGLGDGDGLNVATFDVRIENVVARVSDGGGYEQ